MHIRPFRPGDERALHAVFCSAIHGIASRDYAPEQIQAWAPLDLDDALWADRMRGISPFVVRDGDDLVAYADVQPNGYIDHFFVAASHARRGVGSMLMRHLHEAADAQRIQLLSSHVSRTAQPFFERFGFAVVEQRVPVLRGVVVPNALMHKHLGPQP
jgi:putative acetyltransferase